MTIPISEINKVLCQALDTPIANLRRGEDKKNDYMACTFTLGHHKIIYREAKITPKKIGYFVAIWKRNTTGETAPYHLEDDFDYFVIDTPLGFFLYPKEVLARLAIISTPTKEGKRGMRVYPQSEEGMNKQATRTHITQQPFWHEL